MSRVQGKVAFITGAARGLGRAFAVRLAEEGADLILMDVCAQPAQVDYPAATRADLDETVAAVEKLGRRVVSEVADVRDLGALEALVAAAADRLGPPDVVVANAGILTWGRFWEVDPQSWRDIIDINLTGVYNTLRAAVPAMIAAGGGGSMIAVSSVAGIKSIPGQAHYSAAKHGVVGLVKAAAVELAPYRIRVNSVHPWGVRTTMGQLGPEAQRLLAGNPEYVASMGKIMRDPALAEPSDIADAVLFLASDESRTITGSQLTVDQGATKV